MKVTPALKKELADWLDTYWTTYIKGDIETWATFIRDDYRNIGGTKEEIWNSKQEIIDYTNSILSQLVGTVDIRNRKIEVIPYGEYMMVNEFTDLYVKIESEWTFYAPFRMSSLLEKTDTGWIALHQHGSYPDMKAMEGEAFSIDALKAENAKLQAAVRSRTMELEHNNRELEIEAAVERVRVKSMSMQHPGDLEKVNKELLIQLTKLRITGLSGVSFYFIDQDEIVTVWDLSSPGNMNDPNSYSFRFDSKTNPVLGEFVGILKSTQLDYFILDFPKDKLLQAIEELKNIDLNVYHTFKQAIESGSLQHQWNPAARITDGILSIDLMMAPVEDTKTIVLKMAGAFNQAYQRFLDLQKAEAQTRQAKIETAFEKVRARSLAMQVPEELIEVAQVLRHEMGLLGVEELETCSIYIHDETINRTECWYALKDIQSEEKKLVSDHFPLILHDTWVGREMEKFYDTNAKQVSIVMKGEQRKEWINYCEKNSIPLRGYYGTAIPDRTYHLFKFSHGAIGAASAGDISAESWDLLKRAASVFSLAYSRFKDLTQARFDLQRLKEEKQRAETALSELQTTQKQLIQAEKMASLGELTAGIAHEIQNPLNFVNNFSEVSNELISEMMEEVDKGNIEEVKNIGNDVQQNLEKILHHGKRADAIVKGMLQHSSSGSGKKEPTDINALADEYLRLAYHGLRAKDKSFNATMKTDYDATIGNINIIPQDIGRVILNLITNAFYVVNEKKKSPHPLKGGEDYEPVVTISTKRLGSPSGDGGKIEVRVSDNGSGIPQKIFDKIFQPFFTTKPTGQGTGLGLSLSYDIVKAHGGELKVETKEGEGSTFIIQIPTI